MALLRGQAEKVSLVSFSSFNKVEKILKEITDLCLANERLKRLLYYTDPHALALPQVTPEASIALFGSQIRMVPKLKKEPDAKPYIIIVPDKFVPFAESEDLRSVTFAIDIICNYNDWMMANFKLRPIAIAGEIDGMIGSSYVTGKQLAKFAGGEALILDGNFGGFTLYYTVEFAAEDKVPQKNEDSIFKSRG